MYNKSINSENNARDALSKFLTQKSNHLAYTPKELKLLEAKLNRLWIDRCKANDSLVDFVNKELLSKGYSFKFASEWDKQLIIVKGDSNV